MISYTPITLIGFGVAGQLLLSHILEIVPAYKVAIIDPDFIGGNLARDYTAIQTNTTIGQKVASLSTMPHVWSETVAALKSHGSETACVSISDLAGDLRKVGHTLIQRCVQLYGEVNELSWLPDEKKWNIQFKNTGQLHKTDIVCICTGIIPRQEDYNIPTIPLHIALDSNILARTVVPGSTVGVIGSSHSATLILKHLNGIKDVSTICFYRGSKPFKFARDTQYGGIKQESEKIGDSILRGEYTNLTLCPLDDLRATVNGFRKCDWIIQAIGFNANIPLLTQNKSEVKVDWNPASGLCNMPQIQAFGACVPNITLINNDISYPHISVASFVDQLTLRWPLLKRLIQDINLI